MVLFVLLATALPVIGAGMYRSFFKEKPDERVTLYFHDSQTSEKISQDDYILGILLAQIDENYGEETLRAAAVAMRSAALYLKGACREICGAEADFCDCSNNLPYVKREDYVKKHGDKGEDLISALSDAISLSQDEILLYKNSYALALIHRSSHITTESAYDVFGKQYPYLEPVITPEKAEINEIFVLKGDLSKRLGTLFENMDVAGIEISPTLDLNGAGRVENVNIFMQDIPGENFAEIFDLRSMCFEIEEAYGGIVIRTYGIGNGLGMSLCGAKNMSENGFSYKDILLYYFRGCKIVSGNEQNAA